MGVTEYFWKKWCESVSVTLLQNQNSFLFSLFIFSFISQLIWVRLGWKYHRWFSIQEQVNWCTIKYWSFLFAVLHKPTLLPSTLMCKETMYLSSKLIIPCTRLLNRYRLVFMYIQLCLDYFMSLLCNHEQFDLDFQYQIWICQGKQ